MMPPLIHAGSVRERKHLCTHAHTHTHTHTHTTARFGKDFAAAKSCEKRVWLLSCRVEPDGPRKVDALHFFCQKKAAFGTPIT